MPLPQLIEIVPLDKPVRANITVPGSKSITNRALILAALAQGQTTLRGALWSEDTQVMVDCLQRLGFQVKVDPDPNETCNRTITVLGRGGLVPAGGTEQHPLELFVGNAGTAARFLTAFVCLGHGVYRLSGTPRMHERPQAELFRALKQLGYEIQPENRNDKLPVKIHGLAPSSGVWPRPATGALQPGAPIMRSCDVSIESSSQFASALLLSAGAGAWNVEIIGDNAEESPYVAMTSELIKVFPRRGGTFQIEPDASSGSYFLAAEQLLPPDEFLEYSERFGIQVPTQRLDPIRIANWPTSGWQIDQEFLAVLLSQSYLYVGLGLERAGERWETMASDKFQEASRQMLPPAIISRQRDLGDSIMMAVVMAPFSLAATRFTDLGRLRVQECERVFALRTELTKCGAKVVEEDDTLTVFPSQLHGAEIETYNDHRLAMCFAILGLKVPGIKIKNPSCVKKTFPNFFQKLATPPPQGLGATVLDARTGAALSAQDLFAD